MEVLKAVEVMESIITNVLKAGLFQSLDDVQTAKDALESIKECIKPEASQMNLQHIGSVTEPGYITTSSSQTFDHGVESAKTAK